MADAPTTNNAAATVANDVLHGLIFDVAVSAAEAAIVAEAPFMANPVLQFIEDEVIKYVAGKIYEALAKGATFAIIDAQTSAEAAAANAATSALKSALTTGDQNAIDKATQDFTSAFGKLVHLDGSASP
jgi:hypothetical protein